jgi:branched-chain amino acid transport system ATP-binding protein
MAALLETFGLHKNFGGAHVINGIDFQIDRGETRCVIGPNGAGKSTFFKLLIGEHKPTLGTIHLEGRDISHFLPYQRVASGMSIKFQIPGIFPALTVTEHVKLVLQRVLPAAERGDELTRLLELFNLDDEYQSKAGTLSHGKKQWLEIAMAVALRPRILLLDEPVAGLSIEETEHTGELLKRLKGQGLTMMIVEHDMDFVRQVATRVTVLHGGQVFADGGLNDVLDRDDVAEIYLGKK